ncbi:MAG TPA: thioredoxin-dependent thiol peroxidase [Gemmatimonas sp.]|uniref:thioredoxin-dependent thiol peroxidase n=1 Tax=Gemmatimonas sp. TaxID=1962908 RepID=UPI002EDA150B
MPLAAGQEAPDFTLLTDAGKPLTLSSLRGKWVVLYAYPKDSTATCTVQACDLRDGVPRFRRRKTVVVGISPDSVASHQRFKARNELPFTLVADPDRQVLEAYDVWKEKVLYGRPYMGVVRTTFLIDPAGRIARVFERVKSRGHAEEILAAIAELA